MVLRVVSPVVAVMSVVVLGAGCAPPASQVAPAPVPPHVYASLSCPQLVTAQAGLNRKVARLSAEQDQAAMDDRMGVTFALRPLASLSGGDLRDHVALAKGELAAVNTRLARDCRG